MDLLVVDGSDHVLLSERRQDSPAGLWLLGGPMTSGLSYRKSVMNNVWRTLGVTLNPECLTRREINHYGLILDGATGPQHTIRHAFGYETNGEFNDRLGEHGLAWVPKQQILQDDEGRYHPILPQVIKDFRSFAISERVRDRICR